MFWVATILLGGILLLLLKRVKVFEDLKENFEKGREVEVLLKMDFFNKHDPFAIMVTDKQGRHLGFLKRDDYRLLRTLYEHPKTLVRVVDVAISVDQSVGYINRIVELEMYLGYTDNEL
ncbi:MAG: hypothetical protein Q7T20_15740 [Saprospiraceae bacterium]|nr:hypothetical protein [Saprospiraceae bacterium]